MEDADAEGRYVGGEMGAAAHHVGGEMRPAPRYVGGEMGAPARYTGGGTGSQDTCYTGGEATRRDAERYAGGEPAASVQSGGDETDGHMPHDTATGRLADLLGGEFDLRRAVIESEILTPKYIAKQQF